jgi:hypothetical protein
MDPPPFSRLQRVTGRSRMPRGSSQDLCNCFFDRVGAVEGDAAGEDFLDDADDSADDRVQPPPPPLSCYS